jgi:hypothetical protein
LEVAPAALFARIETGVMKSPSRVLDATIPATITEPSQTHPRRAWLDDLCHV